MNGYANALLTTLLAWAQGIARALWQLISGEDGGMLRWIADNWLTLTIILCVVCTAVDLLVYMLRWQPHRVWASFFRRMKRRSGEREVSGPVRQWVYADGSARTERVRYPGMEPSAGTMPIPVVPREIPAEQLPAESVPQPQTDDWQAAYRRPEAEAVEPDMPAPRQRRAERRAPSKTVQRLSRLLAAPEDEDTLPRYVAPKPAVDKSQAYHEPYIPPQWKRPDDGTDLPG